jgi:hypothetical protein
VVEPILLEVDQIYHLACPASPVHYKWAGPRGGRGGGVAAAGAGLGAAAALPPLILAQQLADLAAAAPHHTIVLPPPPPCVQVQPHQDHQDLLHRHHEHAGPGQALPRPLPHLLHLGGLRRPAAAPTGGPPALTASAA